MPQERRSQTHGETRDCKSLVPWALQWLAMPRCNLKDWGEIIENLTLAGPTWMSQTVSKWLVNRLQSQYVPFLNRLRSQSYNPVANHLLNSWDIQAPQETSRNKDLQCFVFWEGNLVFFSTKNNLCAGYVFAIRQAIWCIWCPWDVNIKYR